MKKNTLKLALMSLSLLTTTMHASIQERPPIALLQEDGSIKLRGINYTAPVAQLHESGQISLDREIYEPHEVEFFCNNYKILGYVDILSGKALAEVTPVFRVKISYVSPVTASNPRKTTYQALMLTPKIEELRLEITETSNPRSREEKALLSKISDDKNIYMISVIQSIDYTASIFNKEGIRLGMDVKQTVETTIGSIKQIYSTR